MPAKPAQPLVTAALLAALALAPPPPSAAADWPRFRGPDLDGRSQETGLLASWPEGGPPLLWKRVAGDGYSGMSVVGPRLFTMFNRGEDEMLLAYDVATGKELWQARLDKAYTDGQGNGPRSTPAVDGDRVFALGARGKLMALAAATGKVLWQHDLVKEHGAVPPQWGVSTEPLVEGDRVYVNAGGKGASLVAFDKATGDVAWTAEDDPAGYASPLLLTVAGKRQLIFFTGQSLLAVSPEDGSRLWRLPWDTSYQVNAATPIFVPPDRLYVSSGYDTGAALLRLGVDGKQAKVETVWQSKVLKNQFSSSVIVDGHVYGFDNRVLKCVALMTGEEKWKESGLGHGSLVWAEKKLHVLAEDCRLVLIDASPEGYRELGSFAPLAGRCWTVPTLASGRLFVRNQEEIHAYDVAERK